MDLSVVERAEREDLAFGQAVAMGASCEPPHGLPYVPDVVAALQKLDGDVFVVVEQDMYPVDFDKPKPIATRTREYLRSIGVGRVTGGFSPPSAMNFAMRSSSVGSGTEPRARIAS